MHLFSWSFLLQRSFSWQWYIARTVNCVCTLTSFFSFPWSVVLPHPNPQSLIHVCLFCLWLIYLSPVCLTAITLPQKLIFPSSFFSPPFWTTAHAFPWMSSRSNINMKWQPCQKGLNAERSRPSSPPPHPLNISHLFLTHLSCAFWVWLNPSLQPAVPLSLCCRVALRSMVTLAQFELLWCQNYCCHGNEYLTYFDGSVCCQP